MHFNAFLRLTISFTLFRFSWFPNNSLWADTTLFINNLKMRFASFFASERITVSQFNIFMDGNIKLLVNAYI